MKRVIITTIIGVNLLLVLGWIAFERMVGKDEPAPISSSAVAADGTGNPASASPQDGPEAASIASPDTAADTTTDSGVSRRFDWRRTRVPSAVRTEEPSRRTNNTENDVGPSPRIVESESVRKAPQERASRPALVPAPSPAPASRPPVRAPPSDSEEPVPDKPRDPSEDRDPPILEWVRFTPAETAAGSEVSLEASAQDDLAGVRDLVGRLTSPSGNAHIGFALPRSEVTTVWQTKVRIPEKAEEGRWQISWLRITDQANNSRDHRWTAASAPPGSSLVVSSPEGDGDPPVLQSISLNRATMAVGETIRIELQVNDERSGVRFVSGTFQSPSGKAWAPFTATGDGNLWAGDVTVPDDGECGEWRLRRVTAIDNANNQATWGTGDERIAAIAFYRSFSGSCDSEPPVITRIDLDPRTVSNETNSIIHLTAYIEDLGSGVANASGFAIATDPANAAPQRVHFVLQKQGEGPGAPWSGTIQIPQHSMAGRWDIRALRVADEARNQKTFGPSDPVMANAWFIVE